MKGPEFRSQIINRGEVFMEKNRIRPVKSGKNMRVSYSRQKEVLEMPNLIEIQKNSYQWFLDEGLKEVFEDISPISDFSGHLDVYKRQHHQLCPFPEPMDRDKE